MIKLTKEQILLLHTQLIETTGGSNGIRDVGLLESALENPSNPMVKNNYIQVYRQKQQDFVMDWLKIMQ